MVCLTLYQPFIILKPGGLWDTSDRIKGIYAYYLSLQRENKYLQRISWIELRINVIPHIIAKDNSYLREKYYGNRSFLRDLLFFLKPSSTFFRRYF